MAYYYQPMGYPQYVPQQTQTQNTQTINWVQGESGAKSFLVAPSTSVLLMDSEAETFYIKSSDASGMPLPLRTFDYKERGGKPAEPKTEFVTRKEYADLVTKYNNIIERLDGGTENESTV